ncbi:MAG: hypothetical protein JNJ63_03630 [Hyphomonadaceae bacterium]|nr:hypothetical protein [Hyphomonadaceae bacterium]
MEWRSPLAADQFAEYRDASFLTLVGAGDVVASLAEFWPQRGPQWDALAVSDRNDILLIEAKAHIAEMLSPATQARETSRERINIALRATAEALGAAPRAPWSEVFFQLANRLAHLWFLRSAGLPAWLVLVNFVGDKDMGGPHRAREWEAAYQVAFHVMGLPARHALSKWIVHLHPDVSEFD